MTTYSKLVWEEKPFMSKSASLVDDSNVPWCGGKGRVGGSPNSQKCNFVIIVAENNDTPPPAVHAASIVPLSLIYALWVCFLNQDGGAWDGFIFSDEKCVSSSRAAPPRHAGMSVIRSGNERRCSRFALNVVHGVKRGTVFNNIKGRRLRVSGCLKTGMTARQAQSAVMTWKSETAAGYWPDLLCKVWYCRIQFCQSDNDDVVSPATFNFPS